MLLALKGGRVVDPAGGVDEVRTLLVENGRIAAAGRIEPPAEAQVIDISGKLVLPGFWDLGAHARRLSPARLARITATAARGGFTAVTVLPDTDPPLDSPLLLYGLRDLARTVTPLKLWPVGAITRGLGGAELADIGSLADAGAVAASDGHRQLTSAQVLYLALQYAAYFRLPLFLYPEDASLAQGGVMRESPESTRLGLRGIPAAAEEIAVARDLLLAKHSGGRVHFLGLSSAGSVKLLRRAKEEGIAASAAVTPHHLLLTVADMPDYDTNFKVRPPLGTAEDREALVAALADGTIGAVTSDHTPASPEEKEVEFEQAAWGASSLATLFPLLYTYLVLPGKITLNTLVARLTSGPARILGQKEPTLAPGSAADLTVIDPEAAEVISTRYLPPEERNTPFNGRRIQGLPVLTLVGGQVVFERKGDKKDA
jgi:dihydroorotase